MVVGRFLLLRIQGDGDKGEGRNVGAEVGERHIEYCMMLLCFAFLSHTCTNNTGFAGIRFERSTAWTWILLGSTYFNTIVIAESNIGGTSSCYWKTK